MKPRGKRTKKSPVKEPAKRRPGQPRKHADPVGCTLSLDRSLVDRLDAYAASRQLKRSVVAAEAIEEYLQRVERLQR